jgi:lipopolysaccharide transport system permease protein
MDTAAATNGAAAPLGVIRRYLELTHALAMREFLGRYRGNLTGSLGSFLIPLLMLATYTFVFSVLIPVRIRPEQSRLDYGFFLFAGLITWNLFADVLSRAPRLFLDSPQYLRKPLFPISALVGAPCLASFYRSLPWLLAFLVAQLLMVGRPTAAVWVAPGVLALATLLTGGVAFGLASLGVLIRDLSDFVPAGLTMLFFLSPVLYPPEVLDRAGPWVATLNPVSHHVIMLRSVIFEGRFPPLESLMVAGLWTLICVAAGLALYRATRSVLQDLV